MKPTVGILQSKNKSREYRSSSAASLSSNRQFATCRRDKVYVDV